MDCALFIHLDKPLLLRCCEMALSSVGSGVQESREQTFVVPDRACAWHTRRDGRVDQDIDALVVEVLLPPTHGISLTEFGSLRPAGCG
jgi:hypothetical protein